MTTAAAVQIIPPPVKTRVAIEAGIRKQMIRKSKPCSKMVATVPRVKALPLT